MDLTDHVAGTIHVGVQWLGHCRSAILSTDRRRFDRLSVRMPPRGRLQVEKPWIGRSAAHAAIIERIRRLATREIEVLIIGPSGVGKEMYARAIHGHSRRAQRSFVALN